jgi:penicillin-binding protein 1A
MTRAYAHFANDGMGVNTHTVIDIRTPLGETIWRHERDGQKPERMLSRAAVHEMNRMLHNVTVAGTGRRALIPGVPVAGKTGTTNAYRDAWFVGYSGNYVAGVWIGNDDYSPMRNMTGGSLPAMTWQKAMAYAHQGVQLRPIPGLAAPSAPGARVAATAAADEEPRPITLSPRAVERLLRIETLMREAAPAPVAPVAARPDRRAAVPAAEAADTAAQGARRN